MYYSTTKNSVFGSQIKKKKKKTCDCIIVLQKKSVTETLYLKKKITSVRLKAKVNRSMMAISPSITSQKWYDIETTRVPGQK